MSNYPPERRRAAQLRDRALQRVTRITVGTGVLAAAAAGIIAVSIGNHNTTAGTTSTTTSGSTGSSDDGSTRSGNVGTGSGTTVPAPSNQGPLTSSGGS